MDTAVIVDELCSRELHGRTERAARVRWRTGEFRLTLTAPDELCVPRPDASPFLCATLLLAMRLGEDLDLCGPVSRRLYEQAPRIVDRYAAWDPRLYRSRVRAEVEEDPVAPAAGVGSFFSRGVDSLYSAAAPRGLPGEITRLLFCDRLEPVHSERVRAQEVRLAGEAARRLGLPLAVLDTNLRELTDPLVGNWEDMAGAALAFLATGLAGGLGHVLIPSSDSSSTLGRSGTSPLLDPLFSTGPVRVEYDTPVSRVAKTLWLARERRELLPYLKVCYAEDRPDNCGRCSKCLLTMLSLEASGSRELASGFPREIDRSALEALRVRGLQPVEEFSEAERALRASGRVEWAELAAAALRRGAELPLDTRIPDNSPHFRLRSSQRTALLRHFARTPSSSPPSLYIPEPPVPRTSVIMPAYEAGATLREAVESVLGQTVGELELLVVDDGSTTPVRETLAHLSDPRLRIIRHPRNRGLSAARGSALAAARAPLVSQLDADDVWESDYLDAVLPCFDDPAVGLAYANCTILGHPAGQEDYIGDPSIHPVHDFPKIAERNPVPCPTVTMRTLAVRAVGGYARWLRQCEDYHLYLKLARAGWRFAYVDRRLARYRWPEPTRGMSYDARRHELWEHAMFGSFAARHPRTPGPRRQVRVRARRELAQARDIASARPPRPRGGRPRLLVEPGSHALLNLGDVAMLQVCVERLRARWPEASIGVVTSAPELLERHCPGTDPVPASGQYGWFAGSWNGGAYWPALPRAGRQFGEMLARAARGTGRRTARLAVRAELLAREPADGDVREFVGWLLAADGFVVSGRGGTTDAFLNDGLELLELIRTAVSLGIPTAMFSQGFGPVRDRGLHDRAREVLPHVSVIAVREASSALPLLDDLGVPPAHISVTGDDALDPAHRLGADQALGDAIGVGIRVSDYSGVSAADARAAGGVLRDEAARRGARLQPVTVSLYPHESDVASLADMLGVAVSAAASPREAIEQVAGCRVVVSGTYHGAVFALAQGIPVVGLSSSPYYDSKLRGLADLFPGGCTVLSMHEPDLADRLSAAVGAAWDSADERRSTLRAAAEQQIAASREAYERFALSLGRRMNGHAPSRARVTQVRPSSESASRSL